MYYNNYSIVLSTLRDTYEESDLDVHVSGPTIYEMLLLTVYKLFALLASDRTQRSSLRPITSDAL